MKYQIPEKKSIQECCLFKDFYDLSLLKNFLHLCSRIWIIN